MKTKTILNDINKFLPRSEDYAFATQISDLPFIQGEAIARILVLYDYNIQHSLRRIILNAKLKHIRVSDDTEMMGVFNEEIKDWVVTDQFFMALRDEYGNRIPNQDYIPEEEREEGVYYDLYSTSKYVLRPAFEHFSNTFKNFEGNNQLFFESVVLIGDEVNNLFDLYGSMTEELMKLPPDIDLNPTQEETETPVEDVEQ